MADDHEQAVSTTMPAHAGSAARIAEARLREDDLFDEAVTRLKRSRPEMATFAVDLEPSARGELLASVEADRAAFREAFLDQRETRDTYLRARRRALVALVGGVFLAGAFLAIKSGTARGLRPLDGVFAVGVAIYAIVGASFLGVRLRGQVGIWAARDRAGLAWRDQASAEELYVRALERTAIPEAFRRSESQRVRDGGTPAPPSGVRSEPDPIPRAGAPEPAVAARTVPARKAGTAPVLGPLDPSWLVQTTRATTLVDTDAVAKIRELVESLSGATIGIAGPRGVGKSTLTESLLGKWSSEQQYLTVSITAPIRYEPRDFVLTMFAEVCERVAKVQATRPQPTERWRVYGTMLALCLSLIGGIVYLTNISVAGSARHEWGAGLIGCGLLALALSWLPRARPEPFAPPSRRTNEQLRQANPQEAGADLLREIRFQLTFTGGYAGKLVAPVGEISSSRSVALAQRPESYPEVIARFRAFLEGAANDYRKVVIAIDELDKLPTDDAVRFLDDIKSLFAIDRCFFLLAVSEDALNLFERRGIPARDAFDSAIDEIVQVRPLDLQQTQDLIDSRTVGMPSSLMAVCHVLAGGLPRDSIRLARKVAFESGKNRSTVDVAHELIVGDLADRLAATRATIHERNRDGRYSDLDEWLSSLQRLDHEMVSQLATVPAFPALARPKRASAEEEQADREVRDLVFSAAAYAYIARTLVEVTVAIGAGHGRPRRLVESLAQARHALAISYTLCWSGCSAARDAFGITQIDAPSFRRQKAKAGG